MIYTFHPIFKETLWGGSRLSSFKNVELKSDHVGESWELSDVPGAISVVDSGPEAGTDLNALIVRHGAALLGQENLHRFGSHFPLLVKFIDACQDLSIQVHPGDDMAHRHHGMKGKTEMWYVLDGEPDARVLIGFNKRLNRDEFYSHLQKGTIVETLKSYPSTPGDVFYIPAGRIHSAGAGTFVAEIQQTSDITYRIYDYNRRDAQGNTRPLQLDRAAEALDYAPANDDRLSYIHKHNSETRLIESRYFNTRLYDLTCPFSIDLSDKDSFLVVLIIEGEATFTDGHDTVKAGRGRTLLVGASSRLLAITPSASGVKILTASIESQD